jgi:hypothetical protein
VLIAVASLAACGGSGSPSASPGGSVGLASTVPQATPAGPPESAPGGSNGAASNADCALFTVDEVEAILGAKVGPGHTAALGTGCQWDGDSSGSTYLQIQVIDDPSDYVEQSLGVGFEKLSGIGKAAFVVPELGGWTAQAQTDKATYAVAVNGGTATKESAISLLKMLLTRR